MLTVSSHKLANALGNRGQRSEAKIPLHTKTGGGLVIIFPAQHQNMISGSSSCNAESNTKTLAYFLT